MDLNLEVFNKKFLSRIGVPENLPPNKETLERLVRGHTEHIPFEFHWKDRNKPCLFTLEHFFHNIIEKGSGGYCFETTLLFNELLKNLGFRTQLILSHVYREGILDWGSCHVLLIVRLEQEWLVDISWYGGIPKPLVINFSSSQKIGTKSYKIVQDCLGIKVLEKDIIWKPALLLKPVDSPLTVIENKHKFHQFDKKSEFYKKEIIQYANQRSL